MDNALFESLRHEDESSQLDFKRDQYRFVREQDERVKGELLKDILAFANAWQRTDAYILIGVDEVKGGRSNPVGVSSHLNDNDLQQFVTKKTQRPVEFSYTAFPYEGVQIGVIWIPPQQRPFYLLKNFGALTKGTVYIRRGSSTDEIARMGVASVSGHREPSVELQFADVETHVQHGASLSIESVVVDVPNRSTRPRVRSSSIGYGEPNPNYREELADYVIQASLLKPIGFSLINGGETMIENAHLEISGDDTIELKLLTKRSLPTLPPRERGVMIAPINTPADRPDVRIQHHGQQWTLVVEFGNVRPKATWG